MRLIKSDKPPVGYRPAKRSRKGGWTDGHGNYWYPKTTGHQLDLLSHRPAERKTPAHKPEPSRPREQLSLFGNPSAVSKPRAPSKPQEAAKPVAKPQPAAPTSKPHKPAPAPAPAPARPRDTLVLQHEQTAPTQQPAAPVVEPDDVDVDALWDEHLAQLAEPAPAPAPAPEPEPEPEPEPRRGRKTREQIEDEMEERGLVQHVAKDSNGRMVTRWVTGDTRAMMVREGIDSWEEKPPEERDAQGGGRIEGDGRYREARAREREEAEARRKAAQELDDARQAFAYGYETPPGALLPKDVGEQTEYSLWIKARGVWRIWPGGMVKGGTIRRGWMGVLGLAGGAEAHACIMPADARPDADKIGRLVEVKEFKTSPHRPPNFLGLIADKFPATKVRDGRFENYVPVSGHPDAFLKQIGFHDVLKGDGWAGRIGIFYDSMHRGRGWHELRGRQQEFFTRVNRDLTSWWSDLLPEERERFWDEYCDDSRQTTFARVTVAEHENADFPIPDGMEKMRDLRAPYVDPITGSQWADEAQTIPWEKREPGQGKPWDFHTFQKKAINFAADHAPRALWAMEMGLGKTLAAFGLYHELRNRGTVDKALVLAPKSAHGSWEDHGELVSDARVVSLDGKGKPQRLKAYAAFEAGEIDVLVGTPDSMAAKPAKIKDKAALDRLEARAIKLGGEIEGLHSPEQRDSKGRLLRPERAIHKKGDRWVWSDDGRAVGDDSFKGLKCVDPTCDQVVLERIMQAQGSRILRVADEVHSFKNPEAARTQGFVKVVTEPDGPVVGMTGTPKPNGIRDFYHVIDNIAPGSMGTTWEDFADAHTYRHLSKKGGVTHWEDGSARPETMGDLYQKTSHVMFARTMNDPDVDVDLPTRVDLAPRVGESDFQAQIRDRFAHWCEIKWRIRSGIRSFVGGQMQITPDTQAETELERAYSGELGEVDRLSASGAHTNAQVMLLRAAQLAISPALLDPDGTWGAANPEYESPKVAALADAYVEHMSQQPETGGIIFSTYNAAWVDEMRRALKRRGFDGEVPHYHGGLGKTRRRELQRGLNSGKFKLLLANAHALSTGANLQERANFVGWANTPWEPDKLTQATGRVWRQGQTERVKVLRPVGSPVDLIVQAKVANKIREGSMLVGATTAADAAISQTMFKPGMTTAEMAAAALGVDPGFFGREKGADNFVVRELLSEDGEDTAS